MSLGPASVCAACKPAYLQRLHEGSAQPVGVHHYGGFWIRAVARIIDAILLNIAMLAIRIPLGVSTLSPRFEASTVPARALGLAAIAGLISFIAYVCYDGFFIARRGATIGKMLFGLKVIRSDGSKVSLGLSFGRYFAQILSSLTLGIGYIMAGFDDQKRSLHDRICETRVIYSK